MDDLEFTCSREECEVTDHPKENHTQSKMDKRYESIFCIWRIQRAKKPHKETFHIISDLGNVD